MPGDHDAVRCRPMPEQATHILSEPAMAFLASLHREFEPRRRRLLADRAERQRRIDAGEMPASPSNSQHARRGQWSVPPVPKDLRDRRVEITGPTHRRAVIDALHSGANVYKADLEDTNAPTWHNMLDGQVNLYDAVRGTIDETAASGDRREGDVATLVVRPRGLHLPEPNIRVDGEPVAGALMDFGLFFFHNAVELLSRGTGPYFYLPKLEHAQEAAFWTEVFRFAQDWFGLARGTIKATALVEHVLAALQTDELLYELSEHAAGLNAGRWDYIFSIVKVFREHPEFVLPDRDQVTMTVPFMRAYTDEVVAACHRHGAHAIGGMSAWIPDASDPGFTQRALQDVRADKQREARAGFDGAWVAHPDLVGVVAEVFGAHLAGRPNQIDYQRDDVTTTASDLLNVDVPGGEITIEGIDRNIRAALHYLSAWLSGRGAVNLDGKVEDTATAEISRSQVWHWRRHHVATSSGQRVTAELVGERLDATYARVEAEQREHGGSPGGLPQARELLETVMSADRLPDFVTDVGLDRLGVAS